MRGEASWSTLSTSRREEVDAEVGAAVERAEARMQAARPLAMFDHIYGDALAEVLAQRVAFEQELEGTAANGRRATR